ncbi:MAG: Nitrilotriacetate monooxygenase component [Actinomycetia bacterium]|nr:Nitrilotriacetate monooxygenase component [Actinomycetes bacterium]
MDPAEYRRVLGHFPTGVTIVTAMSGLTPQGFTVGSFFSVSLEPALVGFCAGKASSSWPAIRDAGAFCVNVLSEAQASLCQDFSKVGDRFGAVPWERVDGGAPRLLGAAAWIDCALTEVVEAGDHEICIGEVRDLGARDTASPLLFHRGRLGGFKPHEVVGAG